jgi:hypothetical protein
MEDAFIAELQALTNQRYFDQFDHSTIEDSQDASPPP